MERTDMTDIKTFVQDTRYKLHSDGRFINKAEDRFEQHPLSAAAMCEQDHALKGQFSRWMSQYDALRPERIPYNDGQAGRDSWQGGSRALRLRLSRCHLP
ncbi:MAG: hypothetical protein ACJ0BK_09030 [Coraliomargaritaceae bacterium]